MWAVRVQFMLVWVFCLNGLVIANFESVVV